ncbi:hypothetical protein VTK73DRAFT_3436 [Phialemonium thermophilum]|uniref:Uncharacterized protein n=1 Tax=Phialemonium thermophilum TaxID=223376 RepID=A0ABR3VIS3_9PEZI
MIPSRASRLLNMAFWGVDTKSLACVRSLTGTNETKEDRLETGCIRNRTPRLGETRLSWVSYSKPRTPT